MRLDALIAPAGASIPSGGGIDVRGVAADSRHVRAGYLFAAVQGWRTDGHAFVTDSVANGAVAVVAERPVDVDVPVIVVPNARLALARISAAFFAERPPHVACVTGTDGKTSTVLLTRRLLERCGANAASVGTPGIETGGGRTRVARASRLTTPDPVSLHACLRDMAARRVDYAIVEASSHGLAQYRLDGLHVHAAAFTNCTREHVDDHAGMAAYRAAKTRLFTELLAKDGVAVVNVADPFGPRLADEIRMTGRRVMTVGVDTADLFARIRERRPGRTIVDVMIADRRYEADLPLVGDFQVDNLQAALGLAMTFGFPADALCAACRDVGMIAGRMKHVGRSSSGADVYVDFAHTPAALAKATSSLRMRMCPGTALHLVFGCGGERDVWKRGAMGAVAASRADRAIVTDDNPRSEDPAAIRAGIMASCPVADEIPNRADAIAAAIRAAGRGDVVLIAGLGDGTERDLGRGGGVPFDDAAVAVAVMADADAAEVSSEAGVLPMRPVT